MNINDHRRLQAEMSQRVTIKRRVAQAQKRAAAAQRPAGPCTCFTCQLKNALRQAQKQADDAPAAVDLSTARH